MARPDRPAVIVVSHICPFPVVHGNRSRLVALLRWLRERGFHVTYVLQPLDVDDAGAIPRLREVVDHLEVIRSPRQRRRLRGLARQAAVRLAKTVLPGSVLGRLRGVWERGRGAPGTVMERWGTGEVGGDRHIDRWCWPDTCRTVRRMVRKLEPTAVISEYALLSKCFDGLPPSTLRIIDTVEVFFRNRERFRVEGLVAPFVCTPESEKAALGRADVLIAIQKNDEAALREVSPRPRVITVGHTYAPVGEWAREPAGGTVLYVGSSNPFNVHGLGQFLTHAWPRVLRAVPGARLRVVGSCPRVDAAEARGVTYVGRVSDEDLRREYRTAHVVINPQVAGTGLKIKCVEALTAGCPLVVNRAGADGLEEGAGTAFLLADGWEEFSQHVLSVMSDDTLRKNLESEATRLAARLFSPDATFSELASALEAGRPRTSAARA